MATGLIYGNRQQGVIDGYFKLNTSVKVLHGTQHVPGVRVSSRILFT